MSKVVISKEDLHELKNKTGAALIAGREFIHVSPRTMDLILSELSRNRFKLSNIKNKTRG